MDSTKKLRIVEHLQELGQEAEYLALWLDCDREGENIGFEVISLVSQWIPYDSVYRANFSALTNAELSHAYNNLGHPDKYQAMSVDARQELDLKIGVAFSRLMTRTYLQMATEKFRLRDQKVRFENILCYHFLRGRFIPGICIAYVYHNLNSPLDLKNSGGIIQQRVSWNDQDSPDV